MRDITTFSWGYFGWGNNAVRLRDTIDAIEAGRGWKPPVFVDIRIRREGRARDFRGDRFSKILGDDRYRWIRELGNLRIVGRSRRMQIADPNAALNLLGIIAVEHKKRRRVIFFCSCELPCDCHRWKVGTLLLQSAKRHGFNLTVAEWPGGAPSKEPKVGALELNRSTWTSIVDGQESVPLPDIPATEAKRLAMLAWGSQVRVRCGADTMWLVSGPAQYRLGRWELPVLNWVSRPSARRDALEFALSEVERLAYGARHISR